MAKPDEIKQIIAQLRETLSLEREKIESIEKLAGKPIERDAGLWEYSFDELEQELFQRFSTLEEKSDCLAFADIPSPRRGIGGIVTVFKRIVRKLTNPYSRMILDRQARFNRELVPIHLATILSIQKIKDRLNALEAHVQKILELQEEILEEWYDSGSESADKKRGET